LIGDHQPTNMGSQNSQLPLPDVITILHMHRPFVKPRSFLSD
jgi:hypothetical protein